MKQILIAFILWMVAGTAFAQSPQTVKLCVSTGGNTCPLVTASAPLPVTGSFSATLSGFTPNGNYATLTATAASSASTAMPAGEVVAFQNTSSIDLSCVISSGAATATTNKIILRGGASVFLTVGSNANAACINQTGSASNVVVMAGGTGLGTNFGGGGSGGGGGAVTLASGAVASGAYSSGSIASGAVSSGAYAAGALAAGAFATGSGVDGWDITQGAKADAVCGTATGTCSVIALLKYLNSAVNSSIPAGTALIGDVNLRQGGTALSATNGVFSNLLQGNAVLSATNGLYANQLQSNAVLSATNPTFSQSVAGTAGGISNYFVQPAASDNHATIKNGAGLVYHVSVTNNSATVNYLRLYDAGTGFNGCNSATNIIGQWAIPASTSVGGITFPFNQGLAFTTGISICVTSGYATTDTTNATASAMSVNVGYK